MTGRVGVGMRTAALHYRYFHEMHELMAGVVRGWSTDVSFGLGPRWGARWLRFQCVGLGSNHPKRRDHRTIRTEAGRTSGEGPKGTCVVLPDLRDSLEALSTAAN